MRLTECNKYCDFIRHERKPLTKNYRLKSWSDDNELHLTYQGRINPKVSELTPEVRIRSFKPSTPDVGWSFKKAACFRVTHANANTADWRVQGFKLSFNNAKANLNKRKQIFNGPFVEHSDEITSPKLTVLVEWKHHSITTYKLDSYDWRNPRAQSQNKG